jgi:hypothetical protein
MCRGDPIAIGSSLDDIIFLLFDAGSKANTQRPWMRPGWEVTYLNPRLPTVFACSTIESLLDLRLMVISGGQFFKNIKIKIMTHSFIKSVLAVIAIPIRIIYMTAEGFTVSGIPPL